MLLFDQLSYIYYHHDVVCPLPVHTGTYRLSTVGNQSSHTGILSLHLSELNILPVPSVRHHYTTTETLLKGSDHLT
jgi:hypothetical protein